MVRAPEAGSRGVLRRSALIAVVAGAGCSVALMLRAARRQNSVVLLLIFGIWVLSPFVGAVLASVVSKGWSAVTQRALYLVMLVVTLGSLAIYGDVAFGNPGLKVGFVFLVVPLASWLLMAVVVAIAGLTSKMRDQ
jgi:hypothetical protein